MALFNIFKKKKEKERFENKKEKNKIEKKQKALTKASTFAPGKILIGPHITEKAAFLKEKNAYIFKISLKANKIMVKKAIKEKYGVIPKGVNIVYAVPKKIFVRGRRGIKSGFKKAVVYLKKGEKIAE
jgi:large subunit ribosomal protein L23